VTSQIDALEENFHVVLFNTVMTRMARSLESLVCRHTMKATEWSGGLHVVALRALDLRSGGPWFKSSTLLLFVPVLGISEFTSLIALCK